jgi:hypothetical protein
MLGINSIPLGDVVDDIFQDGAGFVAEAGPGQLGRLLNGLDLFAGSGQLL